MDSLTEAAAPSRIDARALLGPGIYVHVPFCRNLCSYCDFYVVIGKPESRAAFVDDVLREATLAVDAGDFTGESFRSLFFGGGTPSQLEGRDMARMIAGLRERLPLAPDAEISLEANPESLDRGKIASYRAAGVTRVSVGIQSMDEAELARMERPHGPAEVRRAIEELRRAGVASVAIDLIYGLPGSDSRSLASTVEAVLALEPDHVSAYLLTLEGKTKLARSLMLSAESLPDDDNVAEQYAWLRERLSASGHLQYEISNFARPGHESRHNQNYWVRGDYLGLGPAAHSHRSSRRWANARSLHRYRQSLAEARLPREEEERIDSRGVLAEWFFLGLRRTMGIERALLTELIPDAIRPRLGARLDRAIAEGWLERTDTHLRFTPRAYFVSNAILTDLLMELD